MKKVLVVYGTGTGCTAGVAERIGKGLAEGSARVDVVRADEAPAAAGYDAIVVGSGIRGGQWHQSSRTWVADNAAALKAAPVAFYTVCLTLASDPDKGPEVRAYTDKLVEETGVSPVDIGTFAGWGTRKTFSLPERLILNMMKAPDGDRRDWAAIDAWTGSVAPELGVGS